MARRASETEGFEDLSSYSSGHSEAARAVDRGGSALIRILLAMFCILILGGGSIMVYLSGTIFSQLHMTGITKDPQKLGNNQGNYAVVRDGTVKSIAVFGVDSYDDRFSGASDMVMILTVDNKRGKLKLASILRDSKVPIQGDTLQGEHLNWNTKLSLAYAYGGPELAVSTINRNFDLEITDYITFNFLYSAAIVDAFGGVELFLTAEEVRQLNKDLWILRQETEALKQKDPEAGRTRAYPMVRYGDYIPDAEGKDVIDEGVFAEGYYHLNGNQAVAYVRVRSGGDGERALRQQKLAEALLERAGELGYAQLPELIEAAASCCETSLDVAELLHLAAGVAGDTVLETISVPDAAFETDLVSGPVNNVNFHVYDTTAAGRRISAFLYEEDSPYWGDYGNTSKNRMDH